MPIARGGGVIVALAIALGGGGFLIGALSDSRTAPLAALGLLLPLAAAVFFRDPERRPPRGIAPMTALAPADGRVVAVEAEEDGCAIHIYLTLFNVHVVRLPLDARIQTWARSGRGWWPAWSRGAGANPRLGYVCTTAAGEMRVDLVTGLIARRIVPYLAPGQSAARGGRLGLIRFGSRVELRLPADYRPLCRPGARVRGGRTPVAAPAAGEGEE